MHFGVVDHIRASALTTAWNRITDSTHAPPVGNGIGEPHSKISKKKIFKLKFKIFNISKILKILKILKIFEILKISKFFKIFKIFIRYQNFSKNSIFQNFQKIQFS